MSLINIFKQIFKKENNINNKPSTYEEELLNKYGYCNQFNKHITIYFIADTHNNLAYNDKMKEEIKEANECDCCILLGDHSAGDLEAITSIVTVPIYGILGNHDHWHLFDSFNITDINGKVIEVKGVKIAGLAGSFKYKNSPSSCLYTHEESINILDKLEPVDILVTHDKAYLEESTDTVHNGLKGITYYLYKNKTPLHIHGHIHEEKEYYLKNNTKVLSLYLNKKIKF